MVTFIKAGFFTTIQDEGRVGFRDQGVPLSGVMDSFAFRQGNLALGNAADSPALEITLLGPVLHFSEPTQIIVTGANFELWLNDVKVPCCQVINIACESVLKFGKRLTGQRGYLCIKNGFKTEKVLGSSSFYSGITNSIKILKGDVVHYQTYKEELINKKFVFSDDYLEQDELICFPGPEFELLHEVDKEQLQLKNFTISKDINRIGYKFETKLAEHQYSILTSATLPGTIQWTPSGVLIAFMKDAPTTGGYPRILQLSGRSVSILAQKGMKDEVRFNFR